MTTDYPIPKSPSDQLEDLHVYVLPRESWNEKYSSVFNESISEARSAGFVSVSPNLTLYGLRVEINRTLGEDLPPNFAFLHSVGRCMTRVKPKQEQELKCKAYLPPAAWQPEIFVLEDRSIPSFQAYPGSQPDYSPRLDATQPINGMPTHFPQVANHDRMAPVSDGLGKESKIVLETGQEKPQDMRSPEKTKRVKSKEQKPGAVSKAQSRLTKKGEAKPALGNKKVATSKAPQSKAALERTKRLKQTQAAWSKEAKQSKISEPQRKGKATLAPVRDRNNKVRKVEARPEKDLGGGSRQSKALSGRRIEGKVGQESPRTVQRPPGKVIEVLPASKADKLGRLQQDRTVQTSSIYIGQSPMVVQQQQQGYKGDPLQSMMGVPGKSGRPDAYTNNTNEDSGIAEPTPDDDDPDYQRRKSDIDDQYYNQLNSDQPHNRQFQQSGSRWERSDSIEEKEIEKERQRIAEIQEREEERKEEERLEREQREVDRQLEEERRDEERRREEERREDERKQEQRRQEEAKKQRLREMEKQRQKEMEERRKEEERMREEMERRKEAERQFEEERRRSITERENMEAFNGALDEDEDGYNDAAIAMETNQSLDSRGHILDDEHIRRQAERELRDYEPQSTWDEDGVGGGAAGHLPHPGRGSRPREDTEMEMASQQAVQDGLKRVHLTPEVHRKAKVGKIRKSSVTDEEEIYETDPEMANLLEQLQIARQERLKKEKERENLIKRAKELQTKTHERRNRSLYESKPRSNSNTPDLATHPRDYWKKRYFDEKRKTKDLEKDVNDVRSQVDMMHNKLLSHLQGKKKGATSVKGPPSKKNDHKINILKMQHELDEIRRKVDNSRMNLTREVKIRNQAEEEVRGLKSEVTQRKINMTLIRNQKLAALKTADNRLLSKTPIPALGQGPLSFSAKR